MAEQREIRKRLISSKSAEGKTAAMSAAVVPGVDVGAVEEEVAGEDAGAGVI